MALKKGNVRERRGRRMERIDMTKGMDEMEGKKGRRELKEKQTEEEKYGVKMKK